MSVFINDGGVEKEAKMIYVNDGGVDKLVAGGGVPVPGSPFEGGFLAGFQQISGATLAYIVSDISAEAVLQWRTQSGADPGTSPDDGWANSNLLNDALHPAAYHCRSYGGGGFDDWFLLADEQMGFLLLSCIPPSSPNTPEIFRAGGAQALGASGPAYWTSTQSPTNTNLTTFYNSATLSRSVTGKLEKLVSRPVRVLTL